MKYTVDVSYYIVGQGYSHTETMDSGITSEYFSATEWAHEVGIKPHSNEWLEISVTYYADDADPLFDNPIRVEECTISGRDRDDLIADIIAYCESDQDIWTEALEELDGYNGYLHNDRYYNMDDLDEMHSGLTPTEILCRAYYGHDEDNYTVDARGDKVYSAFCPCRNYYKYNGYGNLVSTDHKDYSDYLSPDTIAELSRCRRYIDAIDDDVLSGLFDELEEA